MGLKFKNIITEVEINPKEQKLLKYIHMSILVPYFKHQELPSELLDLSDSHILVRDRSELYRKIYDFLIKTMALDSSTARGLFNLFVLNYNVEGDYKNIDNVRALSHEDDIKLFGESVMALAKHFETLPFMIERIDYDFYGIPSYFINGRDEWYAFANQEEIDIASKEYIELRWDELEVFSAYGAEFYVNYCDVSDTDKRIISNEESNHYESEMDPEEIIDYLRHNRENDKDEAIVLDYDQMVEELEESSSSEAENQYEVRIDEIVNEGRERVREIIYNDTYDSLENHLEEYLTELGYLMDDGNTSEQWERLPSWITFDMDDFVDGQVRDFDVYELSPYEDVEYTYSENGDNYYIIQIDY